MKNHLESRQTLFKWKIGITRVAFNSPATATASQICMQNHEKLPTKKKKSVIMYTGNIEVSIIF